MPYRAARTWMTALAYTAGLVGGFVGMVMGVSPLGRWGQLVSPRRRMRRRRGAFRGLCAAIFGSSKKEVAGVLGPPPAAAVGFAAPAPGAIDPPYWEANTWYYPFDPTRRAAIAVLFDNDRVIRVELIASPH